MTIIEAIKSGRPFRRKVHEKWIKWNDDETDLLIEKADILAEDFVLEPEPAKLPDDRWAVMDRWGEMATYYLERGFAEANRDNLNKSGEGYRQFRVVRVRFEEVK